MRTLNLIILLVALLCCCLSSCKESGKNAPAAVSWSSNDPLSIPLRIRLQKFQRANLVRNSSFESGKALIVDTTGTTFRIDGWQKVGDNIEWVNIEFDSIYNADEAADSLHSVKIHRVYIDETDDKGEGIISDFIKVIPGNYSLSYYIRLEDVCSNKERLGTRLYDAVNIRVYYYDKNKIAISSRLYLPQNDIYINNTFKGISFSNYWRVDKFDWSKVKGKSHNYNCPEGDIPDEARYVKIFFGMKGIGTMWLDNIDFRYTESNFTASERMKYLTDTIFSKHDVIIPQPKEIEKLESIIYYEPGTGYRGLPKIVVPENMSVETKHAALLIRNRLESIFKSLSGSDKSGYKIQITTKISSDDLKSTGLIFSIGKNELYRRFREILPASEIKDKRQSYFIYTNSDINNLVFLAGNEPVGDYYAATTAIQLFDNKKFIFHNAKVIDYPDFENRYYNMPASDNKSGLSKSLAFIDDLTSYKINGAYLSCDLSADTGQYSRIIKSTVAKYANDDAFNFKIMLAPPALFNYIDGDKHAGEDEKTSIAEVNQDGLKSICNTGFKAGALGIAYVPYFMTPFYINTCRNRQPENYMDNPGRLSVNVSTINGLIKSEYHGKDLEILLPWFNNQLIDDSRGKAEVLLTGIISDLRNNISWFWTGNSFYSLRSDNAELARMISYLNKTPVYWDNSVLSTGIDMTLSDYCNYYPGKIRLLSLFSPFNDDNINFIIENINRKQIFFNSTVESELDLIKFATIADFSWNAKTYNPDLALWKVLLSRYGPEAARILISLNDEYFNLVEIIAKLKSEGLVHKYIKRGESIVVDLNTGMEKLNLLLGESHPLTEELKNEFDNIINQYNELKKQLNFDSGKMQSIENID
jgi:hypothetical protein